MQHGSWLALSVAILLLLGELFEATSMQSVGLSRSAAAPGSLPILSVFPNPFCFHTIISSVKEAEYLAHAAIFPKIEALDCEEINARLGFARD